MSRKKFIFVYNADSSLFSQASDFAHKIISPGTYGCNLCKLTHGNLSMKRAWKEFLDSLPQEKIFLHKDQLEGEYAVLGEYSPPCIAVGDGPEPLKVIVRADEMQEISDLEILIQKLQKRITT